jgi:hypothetical protein
MKSLFLSLIAFTLLSIGQQDALTITSIKRTYAGNDEWSVYTNKGTLTLKRTFANGSEWSITGLGNTRYTIRQIFMDDPSEWRISNGRSDISFGVSFPKNYNEWRTGDESKQVYVKTLFSNDYSEWHANGDGGEMIIKKMFGDNTEWTVNDHLADEPDIIKLSVIFIPVIVSLQ